MGKLRIGIYEAGLCRNGYLYSYISLTQEFRFWVQGVLGDLKVYIHIKDWQKSRKRLRF